PRPPRPPRTPSPPRTTATGRLLHGDAHSKPHDEKMLVRMDCSWNTKRASRASRVQLSLDERLSLHRDRVFSAHSACSALRLHCLFDERAHAAPAQPPVEHAQVAIRQPDEQRLAPDIL